MVGGTVALPRLADTRPDTPAVMGARPGADARTVVEVPFVGRPSPDVPQEDEHATDPLVGRYVGGRYFVLGLLASGAVGRLYRARQPELDRIVALKRLNPSLVGDPLAVARFEREARAVSRITHRHVVQVYDFGPDGHGSFYIAMELVPGRTLRQLLREEVRFDEVRLCRLGAQVLEALAAAHEHGVLHRDLRPENVLLATTRDDSECVKVVDFGLAKLLDANAPALTGTSPLATDARSMSPEQAAGRATDARSDLYAAGVLLYELACGVPPFDGTPIDILRGHTSLAPTPPRARGARISTELEALILQALAKDPAARPASAESFAAALRTLEADARDRIPPPPDAPLAPPQSLRPLVPAARGSASAAPMLAGNEELELEPMEAASANVDPDQLLVDVTRPTPGRLRRALVRAALALVLLGALVFVLVRMPLTPVGATPSCATNERAIATEGEPTFCIDRTVLADRVAHRFTWIEASAACAARGKRLCAEYEWERACRGDESALTTPGLDLEWTATEGWARAGPRGWTQGAVPPCAQTGRFVDARTPVRLPARCCTTPRALADAEPTSLMR